MEKSYPSNRPFDIDNEYCGIYDFNTPINGPKSIKAQRAISIDTTASSLIVTTTYASYTVAFIGTRTGHIKKVSIESSNIATEYDDITVDPGFPILKDMVFDEVEQYLYVLSPNKLVKIVVQNCSQYTTCKECKGANDPYCGWCSLENKCSLAQECPEYDSALKWMGYNGETCTKITQVYPEKIQRDKNLAKTTTISLYISNLPTFMGSYKCAFHGNGKTIETAANRTTPNMVKCDTPVHNELPPFPIYTGKLTACYRCTSSLSNCTWCIKNHLCTHFPVMDCNNNEDFIAGQNPYQKPIRCVFAFNSETEQRGEIANMVDMGGMVIIKCKQTRFYYPEDAKSYNVPLKILWGEMYPKQLDNPNNVQVIMYKCEKMPSSCGECLTQHETFSCGWCKPSNQCSLQSSCTTKDSWLSKNENCPNPRILKIYPLFGPKQGGTLLTIDGIDLGKSYEDIVNGISVAGAQCSPIRKEYVVSKQIVCTTAPYFGQEEKNSGQVLLTVAMTLTTRSEDQFTYVDPEITDITPTQGPKSGGTRIAIFGKYLNAGTSRKMCFGNETFECKIIKERFPFSLFSRTFSSNLTCVTAPSNSVFTTDPLYMDIDHQRVNSHLTFRYAEDPIVREVSRLNSFVSGGLRVLVRGKGFNSINTSLPKMVFYRIDLNQTVTAYYGGCLVLNDITMECSTPKVESSMVTKRPNTPDESGVAFGFVIDNVQDIRNFSATHKAFFQICEDPEINIFPNDKIKLYLQKVNEYLTISGKHLDQIRLELDDVVIKIGKSECYVTSTGKQLTCRPPKEQPIPVKSMLYPEVEVGIAVFVK
uniref:Plexin-A2 n=1 Tax=Magallana gigas TaxID=29159 RepID=K1PEA1_MAGGI